MTDAPKSLRVTEAVAELISALSESSRSEDAARSALGEEIRRLDAALRVIWPVYREIARWAKGNPKSFSIIADLALREKVAAAFAAITPEVKATLDRVEAGTS